MIEVKLSQGAKPGHGGILPGKKNTKEIAGIRGVKPGVDVLSPPYHKAFSTPRGLLEFVHHIRTLAGGKPVGFKLCIGRRSEFIGICKAMVETGIRPDFIAVDGGEGGTGAAPLEFSNSVGMPYRGGLAFAIDALTGFDLKQQIKVIAAGKIITGFDVFRALCLGADATYSARAMMFALGCIQALECNKNTCPTGVATQDPELVQGLVVADKATRVYHYHRETTEAFVELLAATGLENHEHLERKHVFRRTTPTLIQRYDEIYPYMDQGCLLRPDTIPESWRGLVAEAKADTWN
jgi:glutamate synthase domain-containing protein 2